MQTWDQRQPIYQQLADLLAAQLLDGDPPEGQAMPSVRTLAGQHLLNPLTVNRALQALGDAGLLENRRGLGLFVTVGARERLKIIYEHTDGFEIARRDMDLRGPGELLGARQSGVPLLRFADLALDLDLLDAARDAAEMLLREQPEAAQAHLARWLGGRNEYLKV